MSTAKPASETQGATEVVKPRRRTAGRPQKPTHARIDQRIVFHVTRAEYADAERTAGEGNVNALAKSRFLRPRSGIKKGAAPAYEALAEIVERHEETLRRLATTPKNTAALQPAFQTLEELTSIMQRLAATLNIDQ